MLEDANFALGIVGGIATVVGFILTVREPHKRYIHALYLLLVGLGVAAATYEFSLNARMNSVAREADRLYVDREVKYTHRGYVYAVLAFLEKKQRSLSRHLHSSRERLRKLQMQ